MKTDFSKQSVHSAGSISLHIPKQNNRSLHRYYMILCNWITPYIVQSAVILVSVAASMSTVLEMSSSFREWVGEFPAPDLNVTGLSCQRVCNLMNWFSDTEQIFSYPWVVLRLEDPSEAREKVFFFITRLKRGSGHFTPMFQIAHICRSRDQHMLTSASTWHQLYASAYSTSTT